MSGTKCHFCSGKFLQPAWKSSQRLVHDSKIFRQHSTYARKSVLTSVSANWTPRIF